MEAYIDRVTRIAGPMTDRAERTIEDIRRASAWPGFAEWLLEKDERVRTWDEFTDLWNEYQQERVPTRPEPRGARPPPGEQAAADRRRGLQEAAQLGAGKFVETPESLRLQPKAKAKAKAKAKGGSRPRTVTRKIQLTNPVLPYHDIMNDGYYIKA